MALTKAHVPGFRVTLPPGRPTEWCAVETAEFRLDVDDIIKREGIAVSEAIKLAIRADPWAPKAASMTMGALEKRYYEGSDQRWLDLVKKSRSYESIPDKD